MATNLFNACLWAGCQILERHCHSIDAYGDDRFYELGRDAAIAYGYKDLIIRNTSKVPLQLRFQVSPEAGQVTSSLWGFDRRPWEITVESTVQQKIPPLLADSLSGWIVETTRHIRTLCPTRDGTIENEKENENPIAQWQLDYRTTSIYQPCVRSE